MQQDLIRKMCRELRLGSHMGDIYPTIEAANHEEFLEKLLSEAIRHRAAERRRRFIFAKQVLTS